MNGDRLLCESCGYPIDGMEATRSCPECGRSVAESMPDRRVGSAWQRGPGVGAWLRTGWSLFRHPHAAWKDVRVEPRRSVMLLLVNLGVASVLATGALVPGPAWSPRPGYAAAFLVTHFLLVLGLATVEYAGIRFLGKQHAFRVTSAVALSVCGHASFGWILSGAAVGITAQVLQRIGPLWNASMGIRSGRNVGVVLGGAAILAAFVAGMLAYSVLCGLGYRAMRFANR